MAARKEEAPRAPRPRCEAHACLQDAWVRDPSGSLCAHHWSVQHQASAAEYCRLRNLRSARDMALHVRKIAPGLSAAWPRDRVIERWRRLQASALPVVREMATQALANLHASAEREPGED